MRRQRPVEERFLEKVNKNGSVPNHYPELGPCWMWTGGKMSSGYGIFYLDGRKTGAHQAAYKIFTGPIPAGMEPDHLCHPGDGSCMKDRKCPHRLCVNPAHLELVTHRENIRRGTSLFAKNMAATHCPQGHEYTPGNTRIRIGASGYENRSCKECGKRARTREPGWHHNSIKTHCPQRHEYTEGNTLISPEGWRICRACKRERGEARKHKTDKTV